MIQLNQLINYLDPRPKYIRVIIIEWSIKSSIPIARTVSLDTQRSLISARRCEVINTLSHFSCLQKYLSVLDSQFFGWKRDSFKNTTEKFRFKQLFFNRVQLERNNMLNITIRNSIQCGT
ncbi:unnamed protein product [Rotaria magnacalcarata]